MSVHIVENNNESIITDKCVRISKRFITAMMKHGVAFSLVTMSSKEPTNPYEDLYGQSEVVYDKEIGLYGTLVLNPPEQFYKDMRLETKGDAVLYMMSYSLQTANFIGNTLLDYQSIGKKLMACHIRIGSDYYRIDEYKADSVYQGFPLQSILVLTFLESKVTTDGN